jgi:hypothetical protein
MAVSDMSVADALSLFNVPRLEREALAFEAVAGYRLAEPHVGDAYVLRLLAATRETEGRVRLRTEPAEPSGGELYLADGRQRLPVIDGEVLQWPSADEVVLVWLADSSGMVLSNRVALDDRNALESMLQMRTDHREAPGDLDDFDLEHPLGELLAGLHREAVFEIDDTPAARRLADAGSSDAEADAEFWDRYLRDELPLDPRWAHYQPAGAGVRVLPLDSNLGWLLDQMLHRVPLHGELHLLNGEVRNDRDFERTDQSWTPSQRLQVRAYNVLQRWCLALNDPRARWLDELAPVTHFGALVSALCEIWAQRTWLPAHRLPGLAHALFGAFIRTDRSPGYLLSIGDDERARAIAAVRNAGLQAKACALAIAALSMGKPEDFFAWQPFLIPGLEWRLFEADGETPGQVAALLGSPMTPEAVDVRLRFVARYTDDHHWATRLGEELGFSELVMLRLPRGAVDVRPAYEVEVRLRADVDLLHDPRVTMVARETLDYTHASGVRIRAGARGIATFAYGYPTYLRAEGRTLESTSPMGRHELLEIERLGKGLGGLLVDEDQAAS